MQNELNEKGIEKLYSELSSVDPDAAGKIHPNNTKRVLRALEVYRATGLAISQQEALSHNEESEIEPLYIGITYKDRENLYNRINKRVDIMFENGLLEEVEELQTINYKAIFVKELLIKYF